MSITKLEKNLRDISWYDKLHSKLFRTPFNVIGNYCPLFTGNLLKFLSEDVIITEVDQFLMTLTNNKGKSLTFWVANYPYAYGNVVGKGNLYPSWEVIFKLRELQLTHKDKVLEGYRNNVKL